MMKSETVTRIRTLLQQLSENPALNEETRIAIRGAMFDLAWENPKTPSDVVEERMQSVDALVAAEEGLKHWA
jgi:hypothetical protein